MDGNLARDMLRLLPDHRKWAKDSYCTRNGRRCLVGARLLACGVTLSALRDPEGDEAELYSLLEDDRYCQILAQVISEQFPDRTCQSGYGPLDPLDQIINFNDDEATRFADIRAVLEKADAAWTGGQ